MNNVREPGAWATFQQAFQHYAVQCKYAYVCHSEATKMPEPEGEGSATQKAQANATMYEALKNAVDAVTFTAMVEDEGALDYSAVALYAKFAEYAAGPIAALAGADLAQAIWGWSWPHAAGNMVAQVQTSIKELKALKTRSDALSDEQKAYKTTEEALTLLFRAKMPLAMQGFEPRYRAFNTFTELLNEGSRDAGNIDMHPERFAVLAVSASGGARDNTDTSNNGSSASGGARDNTDTSTNGPRAEQSCNACGSIRHLMMHCPELDAADQALLQEMVARAKGKPGIDAPVFCRMDEHGVYRPVSDYEHSPRSGGGAVT